MEVPINVQTHPQSMVGKAEKKKYLHPDIMVGTVDACEILHHQPDSYFQPRIFFGNNLHPVSTGAIFSPFTVSLYRFSVTDLRINPTGSHLSVARRRRHTVKNWTAVTRRRCAVSAVQ